MSCGSSSGEQDGTQSMRTMNIHATFSHSLSWAVNQYSNLKQWRYRPGATAPLTEWLTDKQFPYLLLSAVTRRQQHKAENILWKWKQSCTGLWLHAFKQKHWLDFQSHSYSTVCALFPNGSALLLVCLGGQHCAPSNFLLSNVLQILTGSVTHISWSLLAPGLDWQFIWHNNRVGVCEK